MGRDLQSAIAATFWRAGEVMVDRSETKDPHVRDTLLVLANELVLLAYDMQDALHGAGLDPSWNDMPKP